MSRTTLPPLALLALSLLFVAACSGGASDTEEAALLPDAAPARPVHETQADAPAADLDGAFRDIMAILDTVYDEEGRPSPSFENLGRVQDVAFDRLQEGPREWPMGTSFSLSTLDDRIFVFVSSGDTEKEGDWFPGQG